MYTYIYTYKYRNKNLNALKKSKGFMMFHAKVWTTAVIMSSLPFPSLPVRPWGAPIRLHRASHSPRVVRHHRDTRPNDLGSDERRVASPGHGSVTMA